MGSGPVRNGSGAAGGYGVVYGQPVTAQDVGQAQASFYIFMWLRNGRWPDKSGISREEVQKETYVRVLLTRKAAQLGVHVDEADLVKAADGFLRSIGRNGQAVPMKNFVEQVLAPEGLSVVDLQNFLRDELTVQQLIQTLGLPGAFVTPQEAGQLYDRENQEVSVQAVFFAASNYLSQVSVTAAGVGQFFTNNMAYYREPDRVQVGYVFFNVTNYLAQSKTEWDKTNFNENVEAAYRQFGQTEFPEAKTPEEAKAKIRELLIRDRAMRLARSAANDFATGLFAVEPVKAENLATFASQKGLTARFTLPFAANYGPAEINVPASFTKAAFQLSQDEPFAGPIPAVDGVYVIALAAKLPSAIPSLAEIRDRVTQDFKKEEAFLIAQRAGTNFYASLTGQLAAGKTFAQAAIASGHAPLVLTPFSLSSQDIPEAGSHANIGQLKQAAFTTPVGRVSNFTPDRDGGFILYVQELLPVDQNRKAANLPGFTEQIRRARQSEAFNLWIMGEANRELQNTPFVQQMAAAGAAKPQ